MGHLKHKTNLLALDLGKVTIEGICCVCEHLGYEGLAGQYLQCWEASKATSLKPGRALSCSSVSRVQSASIVPTPTSCPDRVAESVRGLDSSPACSQWHLGEARSLSSKLVGE